VPSFVTFPFGFAALVAWPTTKSNKNASFTTTPKKQRDHRHAVFLILTILRIIGV